MRLIEIRNLTRTFRTGWFRPRVAALADVSLRIETGAVVALLGPNGAGKTTLLDLILGLRQPDAGSVTVFGEPAGSRAVLARIGHLAQEALPWPRLSARRFLRFMTLVRGMGRAEGHRRVEELLERLDLRAVADRPLGGYSTGMARRLGLVFALLHRPPLLLLDEPTAGLDPMGSAVVREVLAEERGRGTTVVMASHHLFEIEQTCSEAALLVGGRLIGHGPIPQLFAAPDERMLVAAGLDTAAWQRVMDAVAAGGGRLVRTGPALRPPESVFRELLGGKRDARA